ncbi:MAG: hypothetical protein M1819_005924 [Sarea resinae]|nr:MAG: hypothetical protein M1819_005924 [Sarea resinae]
MKSVEIIISLTFLLAVQVQAHMQLVYPAPFNASNNPHLDGPSDPYLQFPHNCCGRQTPLPCRGYLPLLGSPEGAPVAQWEAGSAQNFNITGIGNHWGGSCQVGFSTDNGNTFHVATTYEGNCPHRNGGYDAGQNFNFTVPSDIPTGDVVFAWTWFNREQEFNMNCAAVTITPSTSSSASPSSDADYAAPSSSSVSFAQRPGLLIADTDNGCMTPHTTAEVKYPNPGPDVVMGDGAYPLEMPVPAASCGY